MLARDDAQVRKSLALAIDANPMDFGNYVTRARYLQQPGANADIEQVKRDFAKALELNPNDVPDRVDYARLLERTGDRGEALAQYRLALQKNDQLDPQEPKRLEPAQREQLVSKIQELGG